MNLLTMLLIALGSCCGMFFLGLIVSAGTTAVAANGRSRPSYGNAAYQLYSLGVNVSTVALVIGICLSVIGAITAVIQYNETVAIAPKITAERIIIEQQYELLADSESFASGMEGFEIKQEIASHVTKLNTLVARAETINRSALWMFRVDLDED